MTKLLDILTALDEYNYFINSTSGRDILERRIFYVLNIITGTDLKKKQDSLFEWHLGIQCCTSDKESGNRQLALFVRPGEQPFLLNSTAFDN